MPALSISRPFRAALTGPNRTGLALGFAGIFLLGNIDAAEDRDHTVGHLGFKYDAQVHEAAAAAQAGPKNGDSGATPSSGDLLQLPTMVVTGKKQPMVARELLSPKGRLDLAKTTYLSPVYQKTLGPLAALAGFLNNPLGGLHANNPEAMALYEDDQQKRRNTETKDLTDLAKLSDQLLGDKK